MSRALVAGIGNVFFGDDGFGCEVARRLLPTAPALEVTVVDFGVRGMHLAFELSSGAWDVAIIVDAVLRGGAAGTLYVIDPDRDIMAGGLPDGHGIDLGAVFAMTRSLGTPPARLVVVGCEVAEIAERIGLSDEMSRAIEPTIELVHRLLHERGGANETQP